MKANEIADMLAETGYPVVYLAWREGDAPGLPYICWYLPNMEPETADNTHWADINTLNVELYTKNKQFDVEAKVEQALLDAGLVFTK
ncbi:MAG TPA: hypothetical protein DCG51_05645, partial [Erysipelotrichaceae bacterium]|nr:hypothetical protein [Erysipelotrichaceae bacterium]